MASFQFKKFALQHDRSTMKIGTDAVLLAALADVGKAQSLLDVGCGCGVIAFCLAQKLAYFTQTATIYGIDPDANSIEEAQQNAQTFPLLPTANFRFMQSPLQAFAQVHPAHSFDLIVSNPPFFGNDLKPTNRARLKSKHRDEQLSFPELMDGVLKLLSPQGRFALILPKTEGAEFHALALEHGLFCSSRISIQPTVQKPVHRVVQEFRLTPVSECKEQVLIIRGTDNAYTEAYRQLTKAFLL
ncbi:MAG: methyltransferase domain-containing protein [Bacteroidales bacterium]|nr:methyltransferase domain-containing protein [Bacteroidales bacterium]